MPRYIDADELKPTVGMFIYHGEGEDDDDYIAVRAYRCELIEKEAPTVEAIPIEWIKKYMDKADIEDYGMIYLSPSGPFRDMLKEWEKENARRQG